MLYISDSTETKQTIMVLRPAGRCDPECSYLEKLKTHGLDLVECDTLEDAHALIKAGCRVGILIVSNANDVARLEQCEPFVHISHVSWVGLVAQELISTPRMREFVAQHFFNFITLPADPSHILLTLRHAWGMSFMRGEHGRPKADNTAGPVGTQAEPVMVGSSSEMRYLSSQIEKAARSDATVLITGQSGTGKEIAAFSIHRQSARQDRPFISVNCGTLAPQLLQSELFGYENGAFANSAQRKIGRIEAAQGGTLFLDEIGDMPLDMQANLLRFLDEKKIDRAGDEPIEADVRVIAATHADLADAVSQGRFREDLYYRINVVCITIPQLADRGQDIEDIAKYYFTKFAGMHNRSLRGFSKAAMNAMLSHAWPGNVRELVNRVQRATVMAEGRFIQPEDLGFDRQMAQTKTLSLEDARAAAESMAIRRALSQSRNQISRAATLLGVSRVTLYRLIEKYNLRTGGTSNPHDVVLGNVGQEIEARRQSN